MIKNKRKILIGIALTFTISLLSGCGIKLGEHFASDEKVVLYDDMVYSGDFVDEFTNNELSYEEQLGLIWMYEEEKMARDLYLGFLKLWSDKLFADISKSEQNHMDAIKIVLDYYKLEPPLKNDTYGKFPSVEVQKLYNKLYRKGTKSSLDALAIGAMVEDLDIRDSNDLLKEAKNPDLIKVYNYLLLGSRNHLRAYVDKLDKKRITYIPQYISKKDYEIIISSPYEKFLIE